MSAVPDTAPSTPGEQPFRYSGPAELVEPDWRRLPGYAGVSAREWESAQWQRAHCVKTLYQLKAVFGNFASDALLADIARDQA